MGIYYIGIFPPPYGGVTIKNENLYNAISSKLTINRIDLNKIKKFNLVECIRLCCVLVNRNTKLMIGVAGQRRAFTKLLYFINRSCMQNSIIFIMGGVAGKEIASDLEYIKYMKKYKTIYVETKGMKEDFNNIGLFNVEIYPNARHRSNATMYPNKKNEQTLKCVFFSLIDKIKGADIILETAQCVGNAEFHFYGEISSKFREDFFKEINVLDNAYYHGVFKGTSDDVYNELKKYDVLLLPTKWKAEGVPGILVESKIAKVPAIVSNINYNAEIVRDNVDGIVLEKNDSVNLSLTINRLISNREVVSKMSQECEKSAEQYFIDTHLDRIVECFLE